MNQLQVLIKNLKESGVPAEAARAIALLAYNIHEDRATTALHIGLDGFDAIDAWFRR